MAVWIIRKQSQNGVEQEKIAQKCNVTKVFTKKGYTNDYTKCYNLDDSRDADNEGGNIMHSVFDVAKYILREKGLMTTMKLQKLCYYAQAWSLAWDEKPLFDEDFQAWANGPVCPSLFFRHKGYYEVSEDFFDGEVPDFTDNEKDTINKVLEYYGNKEPQWLSNLTHSEQPWKEARGCAPIGMPCSNVITKESMQIYYGGL